MLKITSVKELQLRTTVRYQHTTIIMNDIKKPDEDAGKNMGITERKEDGDQQEQHTSNLQSKRASAS